MSFLRASFVPALDDEDPRNWRPSLEDCEEQAARQALLYDPVVVKRAPHQDDWCRDCRGQGRVFDECDDPGSNHFQTMCPTCSGRGHH